jgi:cell wall-associated NlpC family hydrolase
LRLRFTGALMCTLTIAMVAAPGAFAETGGVAPGGSSTPAKAKKPLHTAPVTSRSANILYTGPVYQRLAGGEVVPYIPPAAVSQASATTGGLAASATSTSTSKPMLLVPGSQARYVGGLAAAPMSAPLAVQEIIWAGDQIIGLPYIYGGGHASFTSPGYDCSGTVSFALHGASLISTPMDSSEYMAWGSHGVGRWVTIFSNPEHAYMTVAGLRLDTSSADDPSSQQGPRWRPLRPANAGFTVRHPLGL